MTTTQAAENIAKLFIHRNITFAAAESCTGGRLISELIMIPGASNYILGGIVAYANDVKTKILNIKSSLLSAVGAVSQEVALLMAKEVRKKLESNWSIGITGIAGPTGGTIEKPVGTVCIALCGPGFEYVERNLFTGSREKIIEATVKRSMQLILEKIN